MSNVIDLTMSDNDEAPTPARRRLRAVPAIRPPQIQAENLHGILYDTFYRQVVVAKPFPSPGYKPKLSHSFKVKSGFSNSIIPPIEEDESNLNKSYLKANFNSFDIKNGKKVTLKPICASCDQILLQQSKLFGLRCGHVICGICLESAKERVKQKKDADRKANWNYDIFDDGEGFEDDSELEDSHMEGGSRLFAGNRATSAQIGRSTRSQSKPTRTKLETKERFAPYPTAKLKKTPSKGKGKAILVDEVDREWLFCPVGDGCPGQKTDVTASGKNSAGEGIGPIEIYV